MQVLIEIGHASWDGAGFLDPPCFILVIRFSIPARMGEKVSLLARLGPGPGVAPSQLFEMLQ